MRLVVVADRRWQKWAQRLVEAGRRLGMPSEAWDEGTYRERVESLVDGRVLVLGSVPTSLTSRSMAHRGLDEGGMCWSKKGGHAYIWVDTIVGHKMDRRAIEGRRADLRQASFRKRELGRDAGRATGAMVAYALQSGDLGRRHVTIRSRGNFQRVQQEYALLHFLLHGFDRWCELALTPVMSQQREAAPKGRSLSAYVEYNNASVRHPTSTAPSPVRRALMSGSSDRARVDLEQDLQQAEELLAVRERTLQATPVAASDRRMREHELLLARKNLRRLKAKREAMLGWEKQRADAS
jgi:hypothetical protein